MARVNKKEYQILKEDLKEGYEWIARDEGGSLYTYEGKLIKATESWLSQRLKPVDNPNLFQFIQWTDEEPYSIVELINEYEFEQEILARRESISKGEQTIPYEIFDENDKLEVLSKEWIDKHAYIGSDINNPIVYADDLEGLLVPKQELPVIPQCVANYLEDMKEKGKKLLTAIRLIDELWWDNDSTEEDKAYEWLNTDLNDEIFAKAWIDGYTVKEKEPKYYARIKGWKNVTTGSEAFNWVYFKEKDTVGISKAIENKYQAISFTKDEWEKLGIDETNADFVKAEELEK